MFNNGMMGMIPSLADIAAVTGNRNGNGWGDGCGAWWIIVILFALWGGFGNWDGNGFGNHGNGSATRSALASAATQADIQRGFDNQGVINKLNGLENGLCDGFYAMNTSLLNGFNNTNTAMLQGFNGVNTAMMQGNFGIQQAINADTVANMQNTNALQTQLANCCCENRQGQAQIQYDLATNTCAITTAIANQTQQIMQNDNANYRQLHDEIVANRMADKDETIAQLRTQVSQMTLAASQQAQNNYLVNQLRPAPGPAYIVQNPYAGTGTLGCQIAGLTGCCNMAA